jgi:hypothetical protein
VSASRAVNDNPFNNYGRVKKQQYNARIYQPLGGGDFLSIAATTTRTATILRVRCRCATTRRA